MNPGWFQAVAFGSTSPRTSSRIAAIGTGPSGGSAGKSGAIVPGSTSGKTGRSSMLAQ